MDRSGRRIRLIRDASERRRGIYILPNLFTTATIFLGVFAIIRASSGDFLTAAVCIVIAHISDGLDGRIARLTRTTSEFGVQYDSLADLVAFGVAPAILAYNWALARFNTQISHVDKGVFVGLPIPAAADMIAATVLLYFFFGGEGETSKHLLLLLLIYGLALLMVSNIGYSSFKEIDWRARQPFYMLVGVVVLVMVVAAQPQVSLFLAMSAYVVSGPLGWARKGLRRLRRKGRGGTSPKSGAAGGKSA
jgi:CDP-diacylglycerol--serine O-phosphatidyltransferase